MSDARTVQGDESTRSFGFWLRRRRKALDLTQEELAKSVSCSRHAIRKIEADERRPSRSLAERLADKLAIPAYERAAFLDAARAVHTVERLDLRGEPVLVPAPARAPSPARGPAQPRDAESDLFVGRGNEYDLLLGLLASLTTGRGHVALIEGEPGIGKSRLMRELARQARPQDIAMLQTRCYEIERAMAYQPVIDLLTQALALAPSGLLERLAPISRAEIAALVPDAVGSADVPVLSSDYPEARQARLLHTIGHFFDALTAGRRLILIVDDVQWADDASMRFLHYFARHVANRPILVLLAYRDEDLGASPRLIELVESLRREPHTHLLPLARLRLVDTEAWVGGDAGLAAVLQRETDGNPFFMTSMLDAFKAGTIPWNETEKLPLSDALRGFVSARLAHVPPEVRPTLDVAAVLGRRFDFDTLCAVTKGAEDELLHAIETLVRRRLLREDAEGCYDFSHDKVREVAYLEIGAARRMLLHRAVAESLESRSDGEARERDARLAEHYERGHMWREALRHMLLAAERAQDIFALRDALHWLDRAVALAGAHPEALQDLSLDDLYERRGSVRTQTGQVAGAVEDIRRVVQAAKRRSDRVKARDALIQLGMTYRRADDYPEALACLAQALDECRAMSDERRAADTLYHLGTVSWSDGRNVEAIGYHSEAVAICERLRLTDLIAVQAYHGRGEAHFASLEPREAIRCYERSIELARGIGDKSYESENLMMIGYASTGTMGLADYTTAEAAFEAALAIAERADLQWHRGPILLGLDRVRSCTGGYGEALEGMRRTLEWLESLRQTRYVLMGYYLLAELMLDLGCNREAIGYAERGLGLGASANVRYWRPGLMAMLSVGRLRLGLDDTGRELESEAAACRERRERYQFARCAEVLAEIALSHGDAQACLRHAGELLAIAQGSGLKELIGVAHRWCGEALLAQGQRSAALAEIDTARRLAREVGRIRHIYDTERALAGLGEEHETERWAEQIRRSVQGTGVEAVL
ncbi:MAG: AAA family ATPase [Steroidobacteraceae bacterium]